MPKLILRFDDRVLDECAIGARGVSIGRLPDNQLVIDNPAISGHHARVWLEGAGAVIEDLESTNGTFVNDQPVKRQALEDGDIVLIGKHTITFDGTSIGEVEELHSEGPAVPDLGGTHMLDTERHKAMLKKWEREAEVKKAAQAAAAAPAVAAAGLPESPTKTQRAPAPVARVARTGMLTVLAGRTDQSEYQLTAQTSVIGKSDTALVRLRGWFKPKAAAAIARKGDGYSLTPLSGKATVNGQRLKARADLKDGDVLQVSGVTLEFKLKA